MPAKKIPITLEPARNSNTFTKNWHTSKLWSTSTTLEPWATPPNPASHGLNQTDTTPFALHHLKHTHTHTLHHDGYQSALPMSSTYLSLSLSFNMACVVTWSREETNNNLTESKQDGVVHTCRTHLLTFANVLLPFHLARHSSLNWSFIGQLFFYLFFVLLLIS